MAQSDQPNSNLLFSELMEANVSIEQAFDILTTTTRIENGIRVAVQSGQNLNNLSYEVLQATMEHMYTRLKYRPLKAGIESIGFLENQTLQQTHAALEQLESLNTKLFRSLTIAQENFISEAADRLSKFISTYDGIEKTLLDAHARFREKDDLTKSLGTPAWGKMLDLVIAGKGTAALVGNLQKLESIQNIDSVKAIDEIVKASTIFKEKYNKSHVSVDEETENELFHLTKTLVVINNENEQFIKDFESASPSNELLPLDKKAEQRLFEASLKLIQDRTLKQSHKKLASINVAVANSFLITTGAYRGQGMQHASRLKEEISRGLMLIYKLYLINTDVVHSVAKYIKASTK